MCKVHKFSATQTREVIPNRYVFKSLIDDCGETAVDETAPLCENEYLENASQLEERLKTLSRQAEEIIQNAHLEAEQIIEEAKRKAFTLMRISRMEGYNKGLATANEKIDDAVAQIRSSGDEMIENIKINSEKIMHGLEDEMLELSLAVAKKVLDVELERNDEIVLSLIKRALKKIKADTTAKIIMQADMVSEFEKQGIDKVFIDGKQVSLQLAADNDMDRGDLIIETEKGFVDAGVNSQFTNLKRALVQEKVSGL